MNRRSILLLAALPATLLACRPKDAVDSSPDTESPYVYKDTGAVEETAPPLETGDSLPPDETAPPVETGDTGEPVEPDIAELHLYPDMLAVFPGAELDLRLVAVALDGARGDVAFAEALYWSDDPAVAAISEKEPLVTALTEGSTTLWASFGGLEASINLEVIPAGSASFTVVDADTLAPIEAAFGSVPGGTRIVGDAKGVVTVEIEEPGPATFTAWTDAHVPVSIVGTVNRRFVVPVRSQASASAAGVACSGAVDLSGVPAGAYTDVMVGLAAASVPVHPLAFDLGDLVAEDRTVSIWGVDVNLPGNLFVASYVETWQGLAAAGEFGVWSLAGSVPIEEITAGLNGDAAVIDLLVDNIAAFVHGWSPGWTGADGEVLDIPVAPTEPLSLGFSGDEDPLVLITEQVDDASHAVVGLGQGVGTVDAARLVTGSLGDGSWALAMAQVDGLGSGYGMALSAAPVEAGFAELPEFQIVPTLDTFSGETKEYAFDSDLRAQLVRIEFQGGGGQLWDLYFPSGPQSGVLSKPQGYAISWGDTLWSLSAVELSDDTFEGLIQRGALTDELLAPSALTVGRMGMSFGG
jgi:hypothetical protein